METIISAIIVGLLLLFLYKFRGKIPKKIFSSFTFTGGSLVKKIIASIMVILAVLLIIWAMSLSVGFFFLTILIVSICAITAFVVGRIWDAETAGYLGIGGTFVVIILGLMYLGLIDFGQKSQQTNTHTEQYSTPPSNHPPATNSRINWTSAGKIPGGGASGDTITIFAKEDLHIDSPDGREGLEVIDLRPDAFKKQKYRKGILQTYQIVLKNTSKKTKEVFYCKVPTGTPVYSMY